MSGGQLGKRENWRQTSRHSVTTHTVTPNERCSWVSAKASALDDAKWIEKASTKIVATRNRVNQCRNRITGSKSRSSGLLSVRSILLPHSHAHAGPTVRETESRTRLFPAVSHARADRSIHRRGPRWKPRSISRQPTSPRGSTSAVLHLLGARQSKTRQLVELTGLLGVVGARTTQLLANLQHAV